MKELLNYPFNSEMIQRKSRKIRKELLKGVILNNIRVAVLGGSTTNQVIKILELFLLKEGFNVSFYESEYNHFFEDSVFENKALLDFNPDLIYIHTTHHNISEYPSLSASIDQVEIIFSNQIEKFKTIWDSLKKYNCPIIQNNFDFPINRSLGNLDSYELRGHTFFLSRLNLSFAEEAQKNQSLFINDINYLSAHIGINKWYDKNLWYTAKYAISYNAMPILANNITGIIKSLFGKSKKCIVLDLDNTCWGGVIGDDGLNGIKLGNETPSGEAYLNFQSYVNELKNRGIILAVCSKNNYDTAKEGFTHSDSILKFEDFTSFKANWDPKHINIENIAAAINIGLDSLVFIDDNPVERDIVKSQLPSVSVPEIGDNILNFIDFIEGNNFFETVNLSSDDINRNQFYAENIQRKKQKSIFKNYNDFLVSLNMKAEIKAFSSEYIDRITQLINKTNQFNLTTKRYKVNDIKELSSNKNFITQYGKLADKFGDNGLVSVMIGKISEKTCLIDTWLMSCRVIKRDMEYAMFNMFVEKCESLMLTKIIGEYIMTPKNNMVSNLFSELGFRQVDKKVEGSFFWELKIKDYKKVNNTININ